MTTPIGKRFSAYTEDENYLIHEALDANGYTMDDADTFTSEQWIELFDYIHLISGVWMSL